ncbi:MAG: hypothetical protein HRT58_18740 [Crocinitomicaceae bacterium]|nr:hypothetical protein [Flavobacteriales bacterium]NQZ37708.1 hypothetical protein [Crocinitomicaceae bacterium]
MKWTFSQNTWVADDGTTGPPSNLPTLNPKTHKAWKDWERYEDGIVPAPQPPSGYTKVSNQYGTIWLRDPSGYISQASVALDHLIYGAHDISHSGWHLSKKIKGSGTSQTTYYLHETKNTLYLLDQSIGNITKHSDEIPMIEILAQGKVNNNEHVF